MPKDREPSRKASQGPPAKHTAPAKTSRKPAEPSKAHRVAEPPKKAKVDAKKTQAPPPKSTDKPKEVPKEPRTTQGRGASEKRHNKSKKAAEDATTTGEAMERAEKKRSEEATAEEEVDQEEAVEEEGAAEGQDLFTTPQKDGEAGPGTPSRPVSGALERMRLEMRALEEEEAEIAEENALVEEEERALESRIRRLQAELRAATKAAEADEAALAAARESPVRLRLAARLAAKRQAQLADQTAKAHADTADYRSATEDSIHQLRQQIQARKKAAESKPWVVELAKVHREVQETKQKNAQARRDIQAYQNKSKLLTKALEEEENLPDRKFFVKFAEAMLKAQGLRDAWVEAVKDNGKPRGRPTPAAQTPAPAAAARKAPTKERVKVVKNTDPVLRNGTKILPLTAAERSEGAQPKDLNAVEDPSKGHRKPEHTEAPVLTQPTKAKPIEPAEVKHKHEAKKQTGLQSAKAKNTEDKFTPIQTKTKKTVEEVQVKNIEDKVKPVKDKAGAKRVENRAQPPAKAMVRPEAVPQSQSVGKSPQKSVSKSSRSSSEVGFPSSRSSGSNDSAATLGGLLSVSQRPVNETADSELLVEARRDLTKRKLPDEPQAPAAADLLHTPQDAAAVGPPKTPKVPRRQAQSPQPESPLLSPPAPAQPAADQDGLHSDASKDSEPSQDSQLDVTSDKEEDPQQDLAQLLGRPPVEAQAPLSDGSTDQSSDAEAAGEENVDEGGAISELLRSVGLEDTPPTSARLTPTRKPTTEHPGKPSTDAKQKDQEPAPKKAEAMPKRTAQKPTEAPPEMSQTSVKSEEESGSDEDSDGMTYLQALGINFGGHSDKKSSKASKKPQEGTAKKTGSPEAKSTPSSSGKSQDSLRSQAPKTPKTAKGGKAGEGKGSSGSSSLDLDRLLANASPASAKEASPGSGGTGDGDSLFLRLLGGEGEGDGAGEAAGKDSDDPDDAAEAAADRDFFKGLGIDF